MKKFYCTEDRRDFLEVFEDYGTVTHLFEGGRVGDSVHLSRKGTLRLARHLIKLAEKMDD